MGRIVISTNVTLDGVSQDKLVYLSALPALLTQVGVVRDGRAIPFEQMSEMLRKEILSLNSYYSTNFKTGRAELVVRFLPVRRRSLGSRPERLMAGSPIDGVARPKPDFGRR